MGSPTVLVLAGVSGAGKSTLGRLLSERLGWELLEGDDLHPPESIAKMSAGLPLTDDDRRPWLDRISAWVRQRHEDGRSGIVTCSALRRAHRDRIAGPGVRFVQLAGSRSLIAERLGRRTDHFMPQSLLGSQYAALEPLDPDESGIVVEVDREPQELAELIIERLGLDRQREEKGRA